MNTKEKRRLGALDWVIIVVLIACLISIGLRVYSTMRAQTANSVELEDYIISFKVSNIKDDCLLISVMQYSFLNDISHSYEKNVYSASPAIM